MSRHSRRDEALDAIYAQVPTIECKGLCTDYCGPVDGGPREIQRMRAAGWSTPDYMAISAGDDEALRCSLLVDKRCSGYESRPLVCRLWGVAEMMPCPYGCTAERILDTEQSRVLMLRAVDI